MQTYYNQLKTDFIKNRVNKWIFSFVEEEKEENGITFRNYNNFPKSNDYSKIEVIHFLIYDDELKKMNQLPDFLNELPHLFSLSIPMDWLCKIEFPNTIKVLILHNSTCKKDQYCWDKGLQLKELKYLSIPEQLKPFEIDFKNTPNIEWIDLDLKAEKNTNKLTELSQIKTLKHLNLGQAKNFDVFTPFSSHEIESVELFACKGKNFPIQNIQHLKSLKYIRINNIHTVFDCSWLLELPNLIEFEILNVKNVINIEELLKIRTLRSIVVLNCNNPFKDKEKFRNKNLDILRIDRA